MDIFTIVRKTSLLTAIFFSFVIVSFAQDAKTPDNLTQQPASIAKATPANNNSTDRKAQADQSVMSSTPAKTDNGSAAQNSTNTNTKTPTQGSTPANNNKANVVNSTSTNVTPQFNARKNANVKTSNNISPNTK